MRLGLEPGLCQARTQTRGWEAEKEGFTQPPSRGGRRRPPSLPPSTRWAALLVTNLTRGSAASSRAWGALVVTIVWRNAGAGSGAAAALDTNERTSSSATTTGPRLTRSSMTCLFKNALRNRAQETLSVPLSALCASERNLYAPGFSVTVHDTVPVNETPVFLLTPGPVRWRLSFFERSRIVSTALPAFAERVSEICAPGPTPPESFCAGVVAGATPTVNWPFIDVTCTSQTNLYVPFVKVTFHVCSPTSVTPVDLLTPGPVRSKLCISERSLTWIV